MSEIKNVTEQAVEANERILARAVARELSQEEIEAVSGGLRRESAGYTSSSGDTGDA